jgi:hypothetical protein
MTTVKPRQRQLRAATLTTTGFGRGKPGGSGLVAGVSDADASRGRGGLLAVAAKPESCKDGGDGGNNGSTAGASVRR